MKLNFNSLKKTVWLMSSVLILASCESDTWKDHYSYNPGSGVSVQSLAETIENTPGSDKFVQALKNTYMYNGDKQLFITYWDLLQESQFLTVWMPLESAVPDTLWAKYTMDKHNPAKDHKKVGTEFILNHIAHFSHTVDANTKEKIYMLSEKAFRSAKDNMGGVKYTDKNIRCTNGLLHKLDGYLDYRPSIYEYLIQTPEYRSVLGQWLEKYTVEEIDPKKSIAAGVNKNGEMEYVDSVMVKTSAIMKKYGLIQEEDSNYAAVITTPAVWGAKYEQIKPYFKFEDYLEGADSLQEYNTQCAMLTDAFFNMNIQRTTDSITSTLFRRDDRDENKKQYHLYNNPYSAGGIFAADDSIMCSNGIIYVWNSWPFDDSRTYRRPIKIEAENAKMNSVGVFTQNKRYVSSINGNKLKDMVTVLEFFGPNKAWDTSFPINNNLCGKYQVKLVVAPNGNMPIYVHPSVTYINSEGNLVKLLDETSGSGPNKKPRIFSNDMEKLDTMLIGSVDVPACNFNVESKLSVRLESRILTTTQSNNYSEKMWLDCIILEPVDE